MAERRLRLGVAGLGRGFMLMLPAFRAHPKIALVACADPRPEACAAFAAEFKARAFDTVENLCADREIEAIYIGTPHEFHARHAIAAAKAGKHVLVEKPMAIDLDQCRAMIDASRQAGTALLVGHSHSSDAPIAQTRRLIASGAYGKLRMITALNYTDFLYRPRRAAELDTAQGGGALFSQASHQVDIVRLLAGGMTRSVRASTGAWDATRRSEGAYSAFLDFADGVAASLTYSGYGHFDSDELMGWIGETGRPKDPARYGAARKLLDQAADAGAEADLKARRAYGTSAGEPAGEAPFHEHFGLIVASCERADLRPMPQGSLVYGDREWNLHPLAKPVVPRSAVIDELYEAAVNHQAPLHSGAWGMATLEVCLAMLQSAAERREIALSHQVPA
jgi:phthalate 4,5-cis-dihydrodiol dehydrogenase